MADRPEREWGWEEALLTPARALFAGTAERHGLRHEWAPSLPVEIACEYPQQPGLDFRLSLFLSGDEFICVGDGWKADIFPADDEERMTRRSGISSHASWTGW